MVEDNVAARVRERPLGNRSGCNLHYRKPWDAHDDTVHVIVVRRRQIIDRGEML